MSRTAATIFGVLLVAFSIGFNTSRYPIVWRMTGPSAEAAAASPAPPAAPAPAKQAEPEKEKAAAPAPPASMETKPPADAAIEKVVAAMIPPPSEVGRPNAAAPPADKRFLLASTPGDGSLTPVPRVISVDRVLGEPDPAALVRRLPPVDPNVPAPAQDTSPLPGGAIPIYPSTGIEK